MKHISALIGVVLLAFGTQSFAEVFHCKGSVEYAGVNYQLRIDIELPKEINAVASIPSSQGGTQLVPVGRGRIDVREIASDWPGKVRTSDLYVTSLDTGIITGFFFEGILVYVLRLSPRAKSFSYYDSFLERLVAGSCA